MNSKPEATHPTDEQAIKEGPFGRTIFFIVRIFQILGLFTLNLYAIFFIKIAIFNTPRLIEQEINLLRLLQTAGLDMQRMASSEGLPEGPLGIDISPVAWLIICIIAAIYFVVLIVKWVPIVIRQWVQVVQCSWRRSFFSFLSCILTVIWALLSTLLLILLIILFLYTLLINIAALVAVVGG